MDTFLNDIFNQTGNAPVLNSLPTIIINLLLAAVLGIVIAKTYKTTHRGISYSMSYAFSIVLITIIVAFVMMVIGTNVARAFTLLGAFTLIRFRTAVKDPKDTAFIFLALVAGLAVGATDYTLAITGTIVICLVALVLNSVNFGSLLKLEQVMYLTVDPKVVDQKDLEVVLRSVFRDITIINVNYNEMKKKLQYSYNVTMHRRDQHANAIAAISGVEGVIAAELLAAQQVIEF